MKISLDVLQIIDAIDQRGSYAAAALALHRVPSALTHAVQKLEDELGVALFEKQGRRAVLTPAGRTLLDDGRHLLRAAADLECRVQRVATGWETELRIALSMLIPAERLYPLLQRFYDAGNSTQIRIDHEVLGGCWDALATGRADLAIGAPGDLPPGVGVATMPLGEISMLFAVAPHHPLAALAEPIPACQLWPHRVVVLADTSQELAARSSGVIDGRDALRVPDMAAKVAAQAAGLGIGHLPRGLAEREAAAGRLVTRRIGDEWPSVSMHIAWRSRQEGKALAWFRQALAEPAVKEGILAGL